MPLRVHRLRRDRRRSEPPPVWATEGLSAAADLDELARDLVDRGLAPGCILETPVGSGHAGTPPLCTSCGVQPRPCPCAVGSPRAGGVR